METDVLIIPALMDELDALLCAGQAASVSWATKYDSAGFRYHLGSLLAGGKQMNVAAAWSGAMGETAAANRARGLERILALAASAP
jgi:hypothetical protein